MNQGGPPYFYPTQIFRLVAHETKHCSNLQGIDLTASFIEQPKGFVDSREILADETLKVLWCLDYVYKKLCTICHIHGTFIQCNDEGI